MAMPVSLQHSLCESENPRQVVVQPKQPFRMPFNPIVEIAGILWFSSGIEKVRRLYSSGLRACWELRYVSREFELRFWSFGRNIGNICWFTIKNWDTNQSITINGLVSTDLFWRNHVFLRGPWNGETRLYIILYPIWLHPLCGPFAEGFMLSVQHIFLSTYKHHTTGIIMCEFRGPIPHSIPQSTLTSLRSVGNSGCVPCAKTIWTVQHDAAWGSKFYVDAQVMNLSL